MIPLAHARKTRTTVYLTPYGIGLSARSHWVVRKATEGKLWIWMGFHEMGLFVQAYRSSG